MVDPSSLAAGAGDPPPIPAARLDSADAPARPLLLWVRTGVARLRPDRGPLLCLKAGEGAWIPADDRGEREIVTEPGTVAFPLWPHAGVGARGLSELTRFDVPSGWQDWLIQLFNLQVTPFSGRGYAPEAIEELLRRPGSRSSAPGEVRRNQGSEKFASPAMPRALGAGAVAEELVRDPALDLTVEQWASRVLSSARTLRRDFLADTGLTFEQWRLHCRLGAAVEFLAAGYDVDQVAARVGFASRNGLTRAFKGRFGLTPHEFGREISARPGADRLTQRATAARQTDDLIRMMRRTDTPAAPEMLPAASTPSHTNDIHVLSWMYRGSGYLDIGDRRYERERGVATWIPAEKEHVTGLRENSVSLPLGNASTGDLRLTVPLQVRFSPAWDDYLMFCSISARSGLRPDDHDPRHILDLFAEQVAAQRALSVPMPTNPRARGVAMEYLRGIGEAGGKHGGEVGAEAGAEVGAEIHRAFRDETGMTLSRWRYAARMRIARDLLAGGAPPSAVARRIGYAHLPTFSVAFSRFHGLSPRDYQQRESERNQY
ncbi:AraC family transcriptional regulator [Streptomyces griseiscabiei]|uniref:AraC family transcriptional regulator n=1 Tax=Streptomyces griseiscabiei TaxID=2993540 RepID=A0ABU4L740_9ACTN|nr:AraC family transcriptional regulator [Streptomyces griseiscabiei]MBZ3906278.1 AraC family transcriptional regulator [Streptomyces griseiscabiei]MDX2911275.1 AraC family transcriptional regulator [Streptomyces griseiscabiei]